MKPATRGSLISLAVMALTLVVAEAVFRLTPLAEKLAAEDLFTSRLKHFQALKYPSQVVVLGNSRVRHGVDTGVIDDLLSRALQRPVRSWNFGMGGYMGHTALALSLRLLEADGLPEVVVIAAAPADMAPETLPAFRHLVLGKLWKLGDLPALLSAGAGAEDLVTVAICATFESMRHRPRVLDLVFGRRDLGPALGPDRAGYRAEAPVSPEIQRDRAVARAQGYRAELVGTHKPLSELKLGCVRQAVVRLQASGVKVLLVSSPASQPINALADEPRSLVPVYLRRMERMARETGAPFFDLRSPPFLEDSHFTDGDHLDRHGARRYTRHLVRELILPFAYGRERKRGER